MSALLRAHVAPLALAAGYAREQRRRGRRLVLACVFGAVDRAHVEYLRAAAGLGDCVAVLCWAATAAALADQAEIVAGLRGVDLVVPQPLPINLVAALEALQPDVFATREREVAAVEHTACARLEVEVATAVGAAAAA